MGRRRRGSALALLGVALVLLLSGCGGDDAAGSTTTTGAPRATSSTAAPPATSSTEPLPPVEGPFAPGRTPVPGFGEVEVRIVPGPDGEPIVVCVLLAETRDQRARGLMGVTDPDLGGYAGMLFSFEEDVQGGFWMFDTPLPLSIAYLDADGAVVSDHDMEPCVPGTSQCPGYPPEGPYRSALEVPQGELDALGLTAPGARLERLGACRAP